MPRVKWVALCIPLLLFANCRDSKLTRADAERLIRAKHTFPSNGSDTVVVLSFSGRCFNNEVNPCTAAVLESEPDVVALRNLGLITVAFEGDTSRLSLTEKGRQYLLKEPTPHTVMFGATPSTALEALVRASTVDFGAVTGITQNEGSTSASVEYTLLNNPTPFGEHPVPSYNTRSVSQIVPKTANFTKYDDGWRITDGD